MHLQCGLYSTTAPSLHLGHLSAQLFGQMATVINALGGHGSAEAVEKLAGSSHLLHAAAWKLAGNRSLAQASALTHLACYSESASSEDRALAYAQLAHVAMSKKGYK